ncbi:cytidylate kinase [Candidatus Sulfobium mesophilum]|uniref:Cytidylate kinase n=1 Tax=Candidatus Sulfobium mesophilum TaxID=2016548 RepID=A0A2U3QKQ1_9BACT|nr:cytidylate kinase [Candidatus Sulfobium mesophilum]
MKKVIAIDGPSGAGKSTVARLLAEELGFQYLDTGALYRAVALNLVRMGLKEEASDEEISAGLKKTKVEFENGRVLLQGEDVSEEIRSPLAGHYASVFSARGPVRTYLLKTQRDAAVKADLVAEGRDMTTVVFPEAFKKFFLDASPEERARRRTDELMVKGFAVEQDRILKEIAERDARDSGRQLAPLRRADDAYYIDSTGLAKEEVFRRLLEFVKDAGEKSRLKYKQL